MGLYPSSYRAHARSTTTYRANDFALPPPPRPGLQSPSSGRRGCFFYRKEPHTMRSTILPGTNVRSILGEVSAEPPPHRVGPGTRPPYVTISRQVGAGGRAFGQELLNALNRDAAAGGNWTLWDQELVKKVAADN